MMMHGMAIVATDVDGLSDMLTHEDNALLAPLDFDPDKGLSVNHDRLAENILRLIEDDELRQRLGRNARRNYEECFTLDRMILETVAVYRELAMRD